jgi:hypothetical protein
MKDWLRLSPVAQDPDRSGELRRALLELGDKAGLGLRPEGDDVEFLYQTAWFLLRPSA